MSAIDCGSEFDDYGYTVDPETGMTHFLWDMETDESEDPALFESLSQQTGDFIKLPDRSMTDLVKRGIGSAECSHHFLDITPSALVREMQNLIEARKTGYSL